MTNDPNATLFMGQLVPALAMLLGLINSAAVLIVANRRRPPISEELYRDFATKQEVSALEQKHERTLAELFQVQRDLKTSFEASFKDIERALGRIEGKLANCPGAKLCEELQRMVSRGQ